MTSNPLMPLAARLVKLEQETAARKTPQLQASSVHGGLVQHYDNGGQPTLAMGLTSDGTHAVIYQSGPIPPAPTNVDAVGGQLQVTATWDGTFDGGAAAPNDFDLIEVHAGTTSDFIPDTGLSSITRVGEILHPQGSSITFMAAPGDIWVTMVTRTKSGGISPHAHVCGTTVTDAVDPAILAKAQADIDAAKKQIAQAQANLDADKETLTTLQGNLTSTQGDLSTLKSEQTSLSDRISQASQDASNALTQANAVQTSASGGNVIFWSANPADSTRPGTKTSDIWYQITTDPTSGKISIIASWQWDGSTWQPVALAESYLPLVNIGVGTYGQLSGDRLVANSVTTKQLVAQDVAAGLGEFLKLDVGQLTASGASIGSEVVNTLWANLFTANKVTAQQVDAQSLAAAIGVFQQVDASQITVTGTGTFSNAVIQQLWVQSFAVNKITADQINAASISSALAKIQTIIADNIQDGTLFASIGMGTSGKIIAGDPKAQFAQIDQTGFSTWNVGADGTTYLGTALGSSSGNDALEIADSTGNVQAAISADGSISGSSANFDGDVLVGGVPVVGQALAQDGVTFGWLDSLPQGLVGYGDFSSLTSGTTITPGSAALGIMTFTIQPGRMYRVSMPYGFYAQDQSSSNKITTSNFATVSISMFREFDSATPPDPTSKSTRLAVGQTSYMAATLDPQTQRIVSIFPSPAATQNSTMKILLVATAKGCNLAFSISDMTSWVMAVEDVGPQITSTARLSAQVSGQTSSTGGSTTDQGQLVEKQTFTTTWSGTASQVYAASGAKYSFNGASKGMLASGSWDGSPGNNLRSAIVFNNNALSGEPATMASALKGATVTKAQVFLYFPHWFYSSGGVANVHPLKATSLPSTLASLDSAVVSQNFTANGQGVWVTVPTSWFTPSNTGIAVAAPNASTHNYGYFGGPGAATASQRVQIRLTYTR